MHQWKATTEYHGTKDIIHVKENIFKYKSILNTMIYIHLEKTMSGSTHMNHITSDLQKMSKKACDLVKAGFEYVTGEHGDGGKIFSERKQRGNVEDTNDVLERLMKELYLGCPKTIAFMKKGPVA